MQHLKILLSCHLVTLHHSVLLVVFPPNSITSTVRRALGHHVQPLDGELVPLPLYLLLNPLFASTTLLMPDLRDVPYYTYMQS